MKISGIYGIHSLVDSKWYVGQSTTIEARRKDHYRALKSGRHINPHLQSAYKKYGKTNFEFRILEKVSENMLDIRERAWIIYYRSNQRQFGYNLESGGHIGKHRSAETRRKISKAHKGSTHSAETRRRMSETQKNRPKGYHHSEKTKRKLSKAHKGQVPWCKGKHLSEKHRHNISLALRKR